MDPQHKVCSLERVRWVEKTWKKLDKFFPLVRAETVWGCFSRGLAWFFMSMGVTLIGLSLSGM